MLYLALTIGVSADDVSADDVLFPKSDFEEQPRSFCR